MANTSTDTNLSANIRRLKNFSGHPVDPVAPKVMQNTYFAVEVRRTVEKLYVA
jgi:hypothetical protein